MDRFIQNILAVALLLFASAVSTATICDRSLSRWPELASCNIASQDSVSQFVTPKIIASKKQGKRDAFRMPAAARRAPGLDDITLQRTRQTPGADLTTQYLTKGGTGHVGLVVNTTGTIEQSYRYDAFGCREFWNNGSWTKNAMGVPGATPGETDKPTSQYGFQGQRHDTGLGGVMFFRNRSYEPETGQFLSPDPAGIPDGPNMYSFGGMRPDPVNGTDPMGLAVWVWKEAIGDWELEYEYGDDPADFIGAEKPLNQIGRASCRERV